MFIAHVVAAILCTPWLAYTHSKTGRLFYWSTAGGMQLYWMTVAAPGEWGDWQGPNDAATGDESSARREFFDRLRPLNELERDEAFKAEALRNLSAQPGAYVRNIAANLSRMFFSFPYSHTPQKLSALFYALPNSFLLAFAALALARLARSVRARVVPIYPYLFFAGAGLAGTALLSAYARMLFPFVPVLLLLAVYALQPRRPASEQKP